MRRLRRDATGVCRCPNEIRPTARVSQQRGTFVASPLAPHIMATIHPSALLRLPDEASRHAELERFIDELRQVAHRLD
jgi:uracil-DNA glycosylase